MMWETIASVAALAVYAMERYMRFSIRIRELERPDPEKYDARIAEVSDGLERNSARIQKLEQKVMDASLGSFRRKP